MKLFKNLTRALDQLFPSHRPARDASKEPVAVNPPSLSELVAGRKLVVVSNRGPLQHERAEDGSIQARGGAGGLATAMEPVLRACGGTWVCHGGGSADFEVTDAKDRFQMSEGYALKRVRIDPTVYDAFYNGYANGALWPLFHNAFSEPVFQAKEWDAYVQANQAYCDAVLDEVGDEPSLVIVNDYHLMLLPRMLKDSGKDLAVAMFWHIPWPGRRVLRVCPNQEELYQGILGADMIGLHAREHVVSFLETMDRTIEARVNVEQQTVTHRSHESYVRDFPISIDVAEVSQGAHEGRWEDDFPDLASALEGKLLFLGVDRLDYTKGIPHRISAFHRLLEIRPDLRGKVVLVQIASPSRFQIDSYQRLAQEVRRRSRLANESFGTPDWTPVLLLERNHERSSLFRLYRRADVMLVTSLHDGMNLVCKEYLAAKGEEDGILVLSRFTGAADEFPSACVVNPFDIDGTARSLSLALDRNPSDRIQDMVQMSSHLREADVYRWIRSLLNGMKDVMARKRAAEGN